MAAVSVVVDPLEAIYAEACLYPTHLLREGETGLCLFAAAFLGINDAIHMARAGMFTTCVDIDGDRLAQMAELYYEGAHPIAGIIGDAWSYAEQWQRGKAMFDVVSVDSFTGEIEPRVMASLPLWCSLARRVVTVTHTRGAKYEVPDDWKAEIMLRTPRANWLVLTR